MEQVKTETLPTLSATLVKSGWTYSFNEGPEFKPTSLKIDSGNKTTK